MPTYDLLWTLEDGPGGEPASHSARASGSTPEKAAQKVIAALLNEGDEDLYTFTAIELNEDGEPV